MIRAVIFDMDGVISDTQQYHSLFESQLLQEYGVTLAPEEITRRFAGVPNSVMLREMILTIKPEKVREIIEEKWNRLYTLVEQQGVQPIPHATELIKTLFPEYQLGIASSSRRKFIDLVLEQLEVASYFQTITAGDEVQRGKPEPDIFLKAAEKLGERAENCVVIEDGINGMLGAKRAGMKCIGFIKNDGQYPADLLVHQLNEITPEFVLQLEQK